MTSLTFPPNGKERVWKDLESFKRTGTERMGLFCIGPVTRMTGYKMSLEQPLVLRGCWKRHATLDVEDGMLALDYY